MAEASGLSPDKCWFESSRKDILDNIMEYKKSNREQRQTPNKTQCWCDCDFYITNPYGQKCLACGGRGKHTGKKGNKRKLKREPI